MYSAGRQYAKKDSVWYIFPDGRCEAATVISVDPTLTPTSYGVAFKAMPDRTRETVASRLKPFVTEDTCHQDCEGHVCPATNCQSIVPATTLQVISFASAAER